MNEKKAGGFRSLRTISQADIVRAFSSTVQNSVDTSLISLYSAAVKEIRSFFSYAHDDAADAAKLRDVLDPLFKTSAQYQFSNWSDHDILPGEFWRHEIEEALRKAHFGLLLLSPQFLASSFIGRDELPHLLAKESLFRLRCMRFL